MSNIFRNSVVIFATVTVIFYLRDVLFGQHVEKAFSNLLTPLSSKENASVIQIELSKLLSNYTDKRFFAVQNEEGKDEKGIDPAPGKITLFMVDSRLLESNYERASYPSLAAVINYKYAEKHNYSFIFYRLQLFGEKKDLCNRKL